MLEDILELKNCLVTVFQAVCSAVGRGSLAASFVGEALIYEGELLVSVLFGQSSDLGRGAEIRERNYIKEVDMSCFTFV